MDGCVTATSSSPSSALPSSSSPSPPPPPPSSSSSSSRVGSAPPPQTSDDVIFQAAVFLRSRPSGAVFWPRGHQERIQGARLPPGEKDLDLWGRALKKSDRRMSGLFDLTVPGPGAGLRGREIAKSWPSRFLRAAGGRPAPAPHPRPPDVVILLAARPDVPTFLPQDRSFVPNVFLTVPGARDFLEGSLR